MSPSVLSRRSIVGVGAAAAGVAAGFAARAVAERAGRHREALASLEPPQLLHLQPDEERVVLTDDGVTLHVEVDVPAPEDAARAAGDAGTSLEALPTVVLTHGFCLSTRCWVHQRRALKAAGYRVVSWDHRGHGQSTPGEPDSYTLDRLGADLRTVVDDVAPTGDLVLVGHSMGGMTMLAFGEHDPDLVRERVVGVAFIATSPGGIELATGGRMASVGKSLLENLGASVLGPLGDRPDLWRRIRSVGRGVEDYLVEQNSFASPVPRSVVRFTADMLLGTPLDVIADYLATFEGYDKRPALAHFQHGVTLVFNGTQDVLTPPDHSELIVEGIPGAEHVIVEDAGHVIMLEHPDLLNSHLLELTERGVRARARDLDVATQPRVRRFVTDIAKNRRLRRLDELAGELVRRERSDARERRGKGPRR